MININFLKIGIDLQEEARNNMNITIDVLRKLVREQMTTNPDVSTPVVTTGVVNTEKSAVEKANEALIKLQGQYDTLETKIGTIEADITRMKASLDRAKETKEKVGEEKAGEAVAGIEAALA
jgi:uncharacterized small protein (DUF1192 family)